MTDATMTTTANATIAGVKASPRFATRPATVDDLDLIHLELQAVIEESPHYNDTFKAWEKARMTKSFLRALQKQDPWHVMALVSEGKVGGALISGPEFGSVFRYWSWIFPAFRQTRLGMHGMRAFDEHFDNGKFHKAFTWVRPENEVALALLRRYGYEQSAFLKNQIFGQDYVVMERQYTKLTEGYDTGMGTGRLGRFIETVSNLIGR